MDVTIGPVGEPDLVALNDLYNHYVLHTPVTFAVEPISMDERRQWYAQFSDNGRYRLVGAFAAERLVGFACTGRFRPKQAYDPSVETSIYLHPDSTGLGLGKSLYTALFESIAGEDIHRLYAGITLPNEASVRLHERFGFRQVAYFTEQGRKFGRYWDVAWYEKPFP